MTTKVIATNNQLNTLPASPFKRVRQILFKLFWFSATAATAGLFALTLIGFAGRQHWVLDVWSHFRWYYMIAALPAFAIGLAGRRWPMAGLAMAALLLNTWQIAPYWIPDLSHSSAADSSVYQTPVRLMAANTLYGNPRPDLLISAIEEVRPDILVLNEMNAINQYTMRGVWELFPHVLHDRNQEILIFSHLPIQGSFYQQYDMVHRNQAIAYFEVDNQPFAVVGMHTSTPLGEGPWNRRNQEFNFTADLINQLDMPVVIAGDLNVSSFSPNYQDFLADSQLTDGRNGSGVLSTWPMFRTLVRIPIDHVAATSEIDITHFQTGPFTGSDHLPVVVEFVIEQ